MIHKKTKIVATLGPATFDKEIIKQLILSGMNIARLNFSHGTHEQMQTFITTVRALSDELGIPVGILADLQGPKMRLGLFDGIRQITTGEDLTLTISPESDRELPIQFDLSRFVVEGQHIFLNDGLIELIVQEVVGQKIKVQAKNSGEVTKNKSLNIPDTSIGLASFTQKDQKDAEFALKAGVDYVALSFVEAAKDLDPLKEMIKALDPEVEIMVKIERRQALVNLEEIIAGAGAFMIARGDLATETSPSEIPVFQQKIIREARQAGKPVIVATQMLESMTENPRPTRAEASDVANAVFIQADAVMLSAESATGKYPVESVKTMTDIIVSVEEHPDFKQYIRINWDNLVGKTLEVGAIAQAAASLAYRTNAPLIAVATATGKTARLISSFRPNSAIVALTHDEKTRNQLTLVWGITPLVATAKNSADEFWTSALSNVLTKDLAVPETNAVLVSGSGNIGVPGLTDTIKLLKLSK